MLALRIFTSMIYDQHQLRGRVAWTFLSVKHKERFSEAGHEPVLPQELPGQDFGTPPELVGLLLVLRAVMPCAAFGEGFRPSRGIQSLC